MSKWSLVGFSALMAGCLLVTGCATLNKEECLQAEWRTIGLEDGSKGYPVTRISEHRKACAKHRVQPDLNQYRAGPQEGVRLFCVPRTAYQLGLRGRSYQGVCPKDLEADFLAYYTTGKDIYQLNRQLRQDEQTLRELEREYDAYTATMEQKEARLVSPGLTRQQCQQLLDEIKSLSASLVALEAALYTHGQSLERQRAEIERRKLTF